MIVPEPTELTAPYWAAAAEGRVLLQRCRTCAHVWHPPAPVCPVCRSSAFEWQPSSGAGRLYSYTLVTHPVHAAVAAAVPYVVALVELDEGVRIVCTLIGEHGALTAGSRVTVTLGPAAGGAQLPVARPTPGGPGAATDPGRPA